MILYEDSNDAEPDSHGPIPEWLREQAAKSAELLNSLPPEVQQQLTQRTNIREAATHLLDDCPCPNPSHTTTKEDQQ